MGTLNFDYVFESGNTIISAQVNANFQKIRSLLNGNIEAVNIKDETLTSTKFASGLLAQSFLYSAFGSVSFIGNGCLISDSSSGGTPEITLSAGVIYTVASGELVQHSKSSDTYDFTSNGDGTYYLFISSAGVLSISGGLSPSAGTQLLAKCVVAGTGGSASVTITDYARRGLYRPKELDGLELSYNDSNTLDVYAGFAKIANVDYKLPENISVELETAGNWIGGSVGFATGSQWVYVYVTGIDTWLSVKLSTTAPAYFDEYGQQVASYFPNKWHYASSTPYRCIGAIYTTDNGSSFTAIRPFYQRGNVIEYSTHALEYSAYASGNTAGTTVNISIPSISRLARLMIYSKSNHTTNPNVMTLLVNSADTNGIVLSEDRVSSYINIPFYTAVNSALQIYITVTGCVASSDYCELYTTGYIMAIRD